MIWITMRCLLKMEVPSRNATESSSFLNVKIEVCFSGHPTGHLVRGTRIRQAFLVTNASYCGLPDKGVNCRCLDWMKCSGQNARRAASHGSVRLVEDTVSQNNHRSIRASCRSGRWCLASRFHLGSGGLH